MLFLLSDYIKKSTGQHKFNTVYGVLYSSLLHNSIPVKKLLYSWRDNLQSRSSPCVQECMPCKNLYFLGYHGYPCSGRESNPWSPSQERVTMHARPSLVGPAVQRYKASKRWSNTTTHPKCSPHLHATLFSGPNSNNILLPLYFESLEWFCS